jgi:hypothetical protein
MESIARESEPHGNGDIAILRDDELDAITGGADVQAESTTFGALSKAINQIINSYAESMTTLARPLRG